MKNLCVCVGKGGCCTSAKELGVDVFACAWHVWVDSCTEGGGASGHLFAVVEDALKHAVRSTPGLPLISLNRAVVTLEAVATASREAAVTVGVGFCCWCCCSPWMRSSVYVLCTPVHAVGLLVAGHKPHIQYRLDNPKP